MEHSFGGKWTEEKLNRVRKYLKAYTTLMHGNLRAATLTTIYVDAFAGTGYRSKAQTPEESLLPIDEDAEQFRAGSAHIALTTEPSFHRYLFIERNAEYARALEELKERFPEKSERVEVVHGDANHELRDRCQRVDWRQHRAVVFLDPYGMEVEWKTLEAIAKTQAIDLWILFPLGVAVNRLLMRNRVPEGAWADRLTRTFGTEDWKEAFYRESTQATLFGSESHIEKQARLEDIGKFFLQRLEAIFAKVAQNPLPLLNSMNSPIYLLCFAAGNPKGSGIAVKIAQDILRRR